MMKSNHYNPNIHHRHSIRLKGYDYSQAGLYFITICVQNHRCVFGKIENGEMRLNDAGKIAYNEWIKTPDIRPNIQLNAFVVMPNHIHGIIVITNDGRGVSHTPPLHTPPLNLSNDLQLFSFNNKGVCDNNKGVCDNDKGVCDTPLRTPSNNIGAIVRGYKSAVTKQLKHLGFINFVWQRNYWEHIIRSDSAYQRIANYILNNAVSWEKDKFHKEL